MEQRPEAIIITWSVAMLTEGNNTLRQFMKAFEALNEPEAGAWFQKMRNKPRHVPLYCFIVVGGRILYRANISHYETGRALIIKPNGLKQTIDWPRLVLTGPIVKAPEKIPMRGFQGFRYSNQLFF